MNWENHGVVVSESPIFVFSDDVESFDSLDAMLRYVEPIDVDGRLRVFDAHGREVVVQAVDVKRSGLAVGGGRLEIVGSISTAESAEQFNSLLRKHAWALKRHLGIRWTSDVDIAEEALSTLVDAVHPWTRTS